MKERDRLISGKEEWIQPWKKWGPYISERAWGTVREDYSKDGNAWDFITHDMARSYAYRWSEDGLAGISDYYQILGFSLALWNGKDPILKERLFGLSSSQGNHGEDVKELYYYLDSTPTHSYMKFLYKYPQDEFPYQKLIDENAKRDQKEREYELIDTGVFDEGRYFDVYVEFAKKSPEEIAVRIEVINQADRDASIHILPQLFFRNRWGWEQNPEKVRPVIRKGSSPASLFADTSLVQPIAHLSFPYKPPSFQLHGEPEGMPIFTDNETHFQKLYGTENRSPFVKDAFHRHIIEKESSINPIEEGTKAALHYEAILGPKQSKSFRFWLTKEGEELSLKEVDETISIRKQEADQFYQEIQTPELSEDEKLVQRQALAGMLWSKQFYHYNVNKWLQGDESFPPPPEERKELRNSDWPYLRAKTIISMPDKWEYPWFAAWDLCFHTVTLGLVDIQFAKDQLHLLLTYHYQNPKGQIPAYEWGFSDLNPPVQAWAALRLYEMDPYHDLEFLESIFLKLILNFNWWINRIDRFGNNLFEGGFLGLDNISIVDRSKSMKNGEVFEESDGTGWMGFFTLLMMKMALELSKTGSGHYQELAVMFFEYFTYINHGLHTAKGRSQTMWDEEDGFLYDMVRFPDGREEHVKVRSLVGIIPFYSFDFLDEEELLKVPKFKEKFLLFLKEFPHLTEKAVEEIDLGGKKRYVFTLFTEEQREKTLQKIFDENEFYSPFGIRSLSKYHEKNHFEFEGKKVAYEPGESLERIKGGNSNWRGPIWMPTNFLLLDSLTRYQNAFGNEKTIQTCKGEKPVSEVIEDLRFRLNSLYLRDELGKRPLHGDASLYESASWQDLILFYEHYHGDTGRGLGASHQTGWSGLVALLLFEKKAKGVQKLKWYSKISAVAQSPKKISFLKKAIRKLFFS